MYFLTVTNFIKLNRTFDTQRLPRPDKNYNFADPIKPWRLDFAHLSWVFKPDKRRLMV